MSMIVSFCAVIFPRDVLDEILNLIESGSEGFPTYSSYGENLIARCSQVHDNFTMGVNRKILINLIYLFIQETYFTCENGL